MLFTDLKLNEQRHIVAIVGTAALVTALFLSCVQFVIFRFKASARSTVDGGHTDYTVGVLTDIRCQKRFVNDEGKGRR